MEDQLSSTRTGIDLFLEAHEPDPGIFKRAGQYDEVM
jgi:hypothetical protein